MRRSSLCERSEFELLRLKRLFFFGLFMASVSGLEELKKRGNARVSAAAEFHVIPATGRIQDRSGRERIFHGLNVVMKGSPWHPQVDSFDPQFSFTDADLAYLKQWGMNAVRLGIMWPGVEPKRGEVNSTYLALMQSIVSKLHAAGIYTLLEFHQDLFASQFCGEGLPSWVLDCTDHALDPHPYLQRQPLAHEFQDPQITLAVSKQAIKRSPSGSFVDGQSRQQIPKQMSSKSMRYPASFPEPLGRRWPSEWEKDGWEPSAERCNKHTWWWYYFSYAVSRAFQDLYENKWGWGDLLAHYWTTVAGAFKDQPGILGYELMNEPWPGDIFSNPFLLLPGVADTKNLVRFYDKLQAAVRSVDSEKILFFETITFDDFWNGFSTVPGGQEYQNKTVLSYHYYTPPNFSVKHAFAERLRESKRLGCGSMLTEFFVSTEHRRGKKFWELRNQLLRNAGIVEEDHRFGASKNVGACHPGTGNSGIRCSDDGSIPNSASIFEVTHEVEDSEESGAAVGAGDEDELQRRHDDANSVDAVLMAADAHVQSWIGWEYKAFYNKTGSIVQQSLFGADGKVNMDLAKKLARTYPRAVCGSIKTFSFDPSSSSFYLLYVAKGDCVDVGNSPMLTEVFVHREFYYPTGLAVDVNHKCVSIRETNDVLFIGHSLDCFGLVIDVRIKRRVGPRF